MGSLGETLFSPLLTVHWLIVKRFLLCTDLTTDYYKSIMNMTHDNTHHITGSI